MFENLCRDSGKHIDITNPHSIINEKDENNQKWININNTILKMISVRNRKDDIFGH